MKNLLLSFDSLIRLYTVFKLSLNYQDFTPAFLSHLNHCPDHMLNETHYKNGTLADTAEEIKQPTYSVSRLLKNILVLILKMFTERMRNLSIL